MNGVDLIDQGKLDRTYADLAYDIFKTVDRTYLHFGPNGKILPAHNHGTFFPPLFQDPERFIIPQPEMRDVLQEMRDQGKFLFLATNSHYEPMELIMKTTLGSDWRNFFNLI